MGLFGKSREELNRENNREYAEGVKRGRNAGMLDRIANAAVQVVPLATNRMIKRSEIDQKGFKEGLKLQKRKKKHK